MSISRGAWLCVTAVLCGSALLAACGSSEEPRRSAPESRASGAPVRLMLLGDMRGQGVERPQLEAGARAAADAVNAAGGIRNRPVEIVSCNTNLDPNGVERCARRAVDENFAAVIGATGFGDRYMPILEQAGIPSIANLAESRAERTSPYSFPLTGGTLPMLLGTTLLLRDQGATRIRPVLADTGAEATGLADMMGNALGTDEDELADVVRIPLDAADLSPQAAAATRDSVDGIALGAGPLTPKVVQALRQAGSQVKVAAPAATMPPEVIKTLGDRAGDLFLVGLFRPASDRDPATAEFLRDMNASAPNATRDDFAADTWAGVKVFARAARDCAEVTAACVTRALRAMPALDLGVLPPISFRGRGPLAEAPRVVNSKVIFLRVRDGRTEPVTGGFVDVLPAGA